MHFFFCKENMTVKVATHQSSELTRNNEQVKNSLVNI